MKKLLYITNGICGVGGMERVLSIKASILAEQFDYEVHILTLNEEGKEPFYAFSKKIVLHSISVEFNKNKLFALRQYISRLRSKIFSIMPDIISVCDDGLKGFFVPTFIKTKAKIIYERHASILLNTNNSIKGKVIQKLMHRQVKRFHRFVVLTPSNISEWKGNNIIAIPNPLSFKSDMTSTLHNKKVISVGSHSYNKGYDLLLESWSIIENNHPDWELHIYGKIDKEEIFIKYAQQLKLKNVYFYAPVRDIQSKYAEASIFVLPSRTEGFGMVLIEAMACGVPCVSFNCPHGPADIIADGEDGFLVPEGDIRQLADKIRFLIENESVRKEMGSAARNNVKKYLPENIVKQWDELFKTLTK
jgi:glycosyltransferase involved in cell wall biosynthesis